MRGSLGIVTLALGLTAIAGGCSHSDEAEEWKDKFVKEARYHYQTQQTKSAEIEELQKENSQLREEIDALKRRVAELEKRETNK
jgi:peptidoglycan hydrolase CwlO-like protein